MTDGIHDFSLFSLDDALLDALTDENFHTPTTIQTEAIPVIMEGGDVLGSAPTGTGKTLAFLLPALQHLLDFPRRKPGPPRILILAPTRELAMQIADQARILTKYTHLKIATITGGVAYMNHAEVFSKNQDLVVATTGRLLQYIKEENFDCRAVETLILDEADRMLDMGFAQDIERIAAETRWRKQTLLFSATLEGHDLEDFSKRLLTDPTTVNADPSRKERKKIIQYYYYADDFQHKVALLRAILSQEECTKTIVFVKKRERVHELVQLLREKNILTSYLEGEMPQAKRQEAIKRLQQNTSKVLIATDVAARGIDIDDISHVINFDMPRTADVYLHRIGRTARAGKKGTAIALIEAHDVDMLHKIERYLDIVLKSRIFKELRPKTSMPSEINVKKKKPVKSNKKTSATAKKENTQKPKVKVRHTEQKNKGKRKKKTA